MNANRPLIDALLDPDVYPHPAANCKLIETHISWVIIAGDFAYKLKKPVDLGFLDFSTLQKRHFYCNEELRLNRRLAPDIYIEVVTVNGSEKKPVLNGDGNTLEYAVKMKAFPQSAQLDVMLEQGELTEHHIDSFARRIANFHLHTDVSDEDNDFGMPEHIIAPVQENFKQIRRHLDNSEITERFETIERWSDSAFSSLQPVLLQRKQQGFVRECHGDMHCRNLAWVDEKPVIFDCIEFSPELRWIDVISEIAFLVMDLQERGRAEFAWRFLNAYLSATGDYTGLHLLSFYLVYRAMVRAKVSAIRLQQNGLSAESHAEIEKDIVRYLDLAENNTCPGRPQIIITHGLSGSGKSTVAQLLLQKLPAIRVRSDVERKRLFNIAADTNAGAAVDQGIYAAQATAETYNRLAELAAVILRAGYNVIVDAAFLDIQWRNLFRQLALEENVPFVILSLVADAEVLRQRVAARSHDVSDADMSVLEQQLANRQPLADTERDDVVELDTSTRTDTGQLIDMIVRK